MLGRQQQHAGIVALERTSGDCPVVTFQFPAQSIRNPLLVTLTLCEWQRVAKQIAEAATVIRN
jgi:hypothetical protein